MYKPIVFAYPGNEAMAAKIAAAWGEEGSATFRRFPDGESYLRIDSGLQNREVVLVCSLDRPDDKAMAIVFFATLAKELGAIKVGLVAPYLGYMRQDKRFQSGEAITSEVFAKFLSQHVDWLVTVDPHLHRHHALAEIYTIPARVVHAAPAVAAWIRKNVPDPVLIGPDEESGQWVKDVAQRAEAPFAVLEKTRRGDRDVSVSMPELERYRDRTPVLVDDIISTARTMIETVKHLRVLASKAPVCIGVHAVFANQAYEELKAQGAGSVISANTIAHVSNGIDLSDDLARAME